MNCFKIRTYISGLLWIWIGDHQRLFNSFCAYGHQVQIVDKKRAINAVSHTVKKLIHNCLWFDHNFMLHILITWRDAGVGDMGVICLVVLVTVTVINDAPSWRGALVGVGLGKWFRLIRWLRLPSYDSLKVQWSDCSGEWWARWELHFELSTSQFISDVWEWATGLFVMFTTYTASIFGHYQEYFNREFLDPTGSLAFTLLVIK